jgi:hypothetical protein
MIVVTSIFIAETNEQQPLTFEQLEDANLTEREQRIRELISVYEGKNRVLPIE